MTNFDFLKDLDHDLYTIAGIAEKLYRDEYFEQCMGQTRRFAENAVKKVLGRSAPYDATFDELINTLKDRSTGNSIEKEFIDDLYFLKKAGNISVHGATVKKDAITALECLRRMFEVAINYAVHTDKTSANLLKRNYDEELLLLGRPKQEQSLKEKYIAAKEKFEKAERKTKKVNDVNKGKKKITDTPVKTQQTKKSKTKKNINTAPVITPLKTTQKTSAKQKSLNNRRKKTNHSHDTRLPLFLNPVVIAFSILLGLIIILTAALGLKIQ